MEAGSLQNTVKPLQRDFKVILQTAHVLQFALFTKSWRRGDKFGISI